MKVAKTIDEIFGSVRNYDMVISSDAALVTALNGRIDVPRIGRLASTPKMIAKDHEDAVLEKLMGLGICTDDGISGIMDDMRILETISDVTGYDIRFVHGEVENIRTIRRHTAEVKKHLFGRPSKNIFKEFSQLPTYEMVMSAFDPEEHRTYDGKKVAVIGLELFDDLDKHFIPRNFDEVSLFKDSGRYDIGIVHAVGNDRQVAEHAVDLLTDDIAEDAAIVMDTNGPVADAVRSALYRKGIAFKNTLSARDIVNVRDYMEFIRKALSYETLTVGDVRELFASYGGRANSRYDDYLLNRFAGMSKEEFRELSETMMDIREYTFSGLCDKIVASKHRGTVGMVLGELNLSDKKISEKSEASASYLINSMDGIRHNAEIPDSEKRGVLLADRTNSVFIDRPLVIYLGIDGAWSPKTAGKEYVDRDSEEEKELIRFQVLLQQGTSRVYIVNTMKNGRPARPCVLFDLLNEDENGSLKKIGSFGDIVNTEVVKGAWRPACADAARKVRSVSIKAKELGKFSKTTMNEYVSCPRAYMFSEFVRPADSESAVFGKMVHQFAEFYLCYPEIAAGSMERCADIISDAYAGISCPEKKDLDRSKILLSVTNMMRFIDSLNVRVPLNTDVSARKRKNMFFELFSLSRTSDAVEMNHSSPTAPLHGEFDLLAGNRIVDYKTGRPLTVSKIAGKMDLSRKNDYYELQPFVYLSVLDDILDVPGTREFIQFYALDNEAESFDEGFDVMRNARTVTLLNMRRPDIIRSGMLLDLVTGAESRKFIRDIGSGFNEALLRAGIENAGEWANDNTLFESVYALQEKRTKGVQDAIRYAIKLAGRYMSGCFIEDRNRILLPRESIERFKEYARTLHSRANEQQVSGFPYEPRRNCKKCGFFHMCTGGRDDDEPE